MGASPPFMYGAESRGKTRLPTSDFDPKAATRASWEPKPRKPTSNGPLVSFEKHPDAHLVLSHQNNLYLPLGRRTKRYIKWLRALQLVFRIFESSGALGALALLLLITNVDEAAGWVMRVSPAIAAAHGLYAVYHLSRGASGRTPGSSAAYHAFAAVLDMAISCLYTFGAFYIHQSAASWKSRLADQAVMLYLVPATYYITIAAGGLHLLSLSVSMWLGIVFRRISLLPPDMNPLEDHLTSRPFHKSNEFAKTSRSSVTEEERQPMSPALQRGSATISGTENPSIPFLHTRSGNRISPLPITSFIDRSARQTPAFPSEIPSESFSSRSYQSSTAQRLSRHGIYTAIPDSETQDTRSPTSDHVVLTNIAKFCSPTGYAASERDQCRQVDEDYRRGSKSNQVGGSESMRTESTFGTRKARERPVMSPHDVSHANPLRSHPSIPDHFAGKDSRSPTTCTQPTRSFPELELQPEDISKYKDMAGRAWESKSRDWPRWQDGIKADGEFRSKPYGEMRCSTPPIIMAGERKISSGIDYGRSYRRLASGKFAAEG